MVQVVKNGDDESTDSVCNVLLRLGLEDLHVLRHPNRQDLTLWKQGKGISQIVAFWANSKLLEMVDWRDTFLKGQPKAWEMIVRAMLALEMKNWVICGDSMQQVVDFCMKRKEDKKTPQ